VAADALAQSVLGSLLDDATSLSDPAVARALLAAVREGTHVVVSSSMPVRDLEWFTEPRGAARVVSNRGANGIDGVLATAIGVAAAVALPTVVLIGDVALLHDSSSLTGLADRDVDLTIVVTDNDGGAIFSFLPQAEALPTERFELLFGTPHGTDLVALAAAHGLPAATVATLAELRAAVSTPGTKLVRVATDRVANVAVHQQLQQAVIDALTAAGW
jgi:2-succinyl-5-enolpyruvyl-6-hydroxy-3-cyclohexene-1-carboxylate synthase